GGDAVDARRARAASPYIEAELSLRHRGVAREAEAARGAHVPTVTGARAGNVDRAPAALARAMAEVQVLAVEEVDAVEAAERLKHVATNRHEGAVHPIDDVRRGSASHPQ